MRKSVVERVCVGQQAFSGKGTAIFRDSRKFLTIILHVGREMTVLEHFFFSPQGKEVLLQDP